MSILKSTFAGLELKSPIIVGSSSQTLQVPKLVEYEKAGAGAVVLKSLFEESIAMEIGETGGFDTHPEAYDYIQEYLGSHIVSGYLEVVREAKKQCSIPVIASIACHTDGRWEDFASKIEDAGADALELNVMSLCTARKYVQGDFEKMHIDIVRNVVESVNIPVIVKLGSNLSNPVALCDALYSVGAKAVVLFNRFYPTDIDVDSLSFTMSNPFTTYADLSQSLRWTGIVSSAVPQLSVAVSGGVHCWKGVAKSILSGASAVEVASAIIKEGPAWISGALEGLEKWQGSKGFGSIESYMGKMNASDPEHSDKLLRTQFIKYFSKIN